MRSAVRKIGNSSGIIIPKPILAEIGAKAGDDVDVSIEHGRIVIEPMRSHPRARWAVAAKSLAETGEDIVAGDGDPYTDVTTLERVKFVMKGGKIYEAGGKVAE